MGWTAWERASGEGLEFTDIIYEKKFHTELEGGVARVAFNRPQVYNAFSGHTMKEVQRAIEEAWRDARVGAIVITGVGDHFSSGGDVQWEASSTEFGAGLRGEGDRGGLTINEVVRRCPKPVIAAVRGYCIGGANHLAYTCDFTIAADNSIFGHNGARVGSPNHGWPVALAALVMGMKRAKEMHILVPRYTAQEAYEMGLVNRVVPLSRLEEEVDNWCERLLQVSPSCIQLRKMSFNALIDMIVAFAGPYGEMLNKMHPDFLGSGEQKECQAAFFERRRPMCFQKYAEEHSTAAGPASGR